VTFRGDSRGYVLILAAVFLPVILAGIFYIEKSLQQSSINTNKSWEDLMREGPDQINLSRIVSTPDIWGYWKLMRLGNTSGIAYNTLTGFYEADSEPGSCKLFFPKPRRIALTVESSYLRASDAIYFSSNSAPTTGMNNLIKYTGSDTGGTFTVPRQKCLLIKVMPELGPSSITINSKRFDITQEETLLIEPSDFDGADDNYSVSFTMENVRLISAEYNTIPDAPPAPEPAEE
jgi:hypothetical protein